ncbi:YeeE/YedE thiosulfate transporter family protein [Sphingomonas sp. LaA6.9]|uniref:YeeE/YedE thiosulfate transporter family protein n=1 Tax=Sphingomonas sp. LaA6.9 TaxID=2919914 RepID=UPI001F4FFD39|nr:YeeE/YedE thiosulfate transporter family protein [Sphingomonas sp. LaA6.9]MCJ8158237.1 YeeE/YedE family protein [Sphingomonas sp. LaA6.9]
MLPTAAIFVLVFIAGYATQRGSVCAVGAIQEIVDERSAGKLLGFLFCAGCALITMGVAGLAGVDAISRHRDLAIGTTTIAGGMVFALGAHINGKCAFGTVAALGAGDLAYGATILGFVAGVATMFASGAMHPADLNGPVASPLLALDAALVAVLALALTGALAIAHWRQGGGAVTAGGWSTFRAMVVIGLVNAPLLAMLHGWPYTRLLIDLVGAHAEEIPRRVTITAIFVLGSVGGAVVGRRFAWRRGTGGRWLRASAGGYVMGLGAVLIPGGNDTMLMVGLPLLLPNLSLAYGVTLVTLYALETVSARWTGGAIRWPFRKRRA